MAEVYLYINQEYHTGQVRDVGNDLLEKLTSVVDTCYERVEHLSGQLDRFATVVIRRSVGMTLIRPEVRKPWAQNEIWLARFLTGAKILDKPVRGHPDFVNGDQIPEPMPTDPRVILSFWEEREERVGDLLDQVNQEGINTLGWAKETYIESRVVRQAITQGTYLLG